MTNHERKIQTLTAWLKRRSESSKPPVTADELVERIRRNWPCTSETEIQILYGAVGHL